MDFELKEVKTTRSDMDETREREYKTDDPNFFLEEEKCTIFEKILRTPNMADDIEFYIENKAELYKVNRN
jgi:hypothetical protein